MKLGLKVWSINENYLNDIYKLIEEECFDYIELFSVPGSYSDTVSLWKDLKSSKEFPFIIHAPHYMKGMNLADQEAWQKNQKLAEESFRFADDLDSPWIIFHPGCNGDERETARQIKKLGDSRIIIENKPYIGIDDATKCNGYSPELIKQIMDESSCLFCMDFSHAICASNSLKIDCMSFLNDFKALNPCMYHLCDGQWDSPIDSHMNLGTGNYPLKDLLSMIDESALLSIETRKSPDSLSDFERDISYLNGLLDK